MGLAVWRWPLPQKSCIPVGTGETVLAKGRVLNSGKDVLEGTVERSGGEDRRERETEGGTEISHVETRLQEEASVLRPLDRDRGCEAW